MNHATAAAVLALALAGIAPAAQAQQFAVTAEQVNLRAGPDPNYPLVATLPPRVQVTVYGCLSDYSWCDVGAGWDRGWVYAANLQYVQQNRVVPLPAIGAAVGIGVLAFVLNDYWHDHYRQRQWYNDRNRWDRYYRDHRYARPDDRYRDRNRDNHRDGRNDGRNDGRYDRGQQPAPIGRAPAPQPPRVLRNDPNSGWDSRNPDAPRPDKP
jgi:uncharacterized protein YraI